ncbi:UNVERIFIED_CONTAM: hypothetical protein GTU68_037768 [Idotea baltica]|uniref:Putative pre-16S rRNA nuclease n=1 Tax=Stieleria marina TaxID=1930275 RepID=A0A517P1C8_9BACT|nr:hypothetical protein [Idotea baltica]QDT13178.1 Putative Holliday junction resolvase [Planctomycetes bacterium K23_9]
MSESDNPARPDGTAEPDRPVEPDFPAEGRLAAIDFGTVRIGIAICDPDRILASPLEVHPASHWKEDGEYFRSLIKEERIAAFVVGLPIHCDGGESQKSRECREFARWLAEQTGAPVRMFDERFTTNAAKQRMAGAGLSRKGKKKRVDAIAALVLLESFMESCRYHGELVGQSIYDKPQGGDSLE